MADPTLYLYTSLTAGSSHIITATSRLETILKANKIPFRALDCATDEKARQLWGRRSRGRKLPGLVKFGQVLGDLEQIEEWNEFGELEEQIESADDFLDSSAAPVNPNTISLRPEPGPGVANQLTPIQPAPGGVKKDPNTASVPSSRASSESRHISITEPTALEREGRSPIATPSENPMTMTMRQLGAEAAARAKDRKASGTTPKASTGNTALPKPDVTLSPPPAVPDAKEREASDPSQEPAVTAAKTPAQLAAEGAKKTSIDKIDATTPSDASDTSLDASNEAEPNKDANSASPSTEEQLLNLRRQSTQTATPSKLAESVSAEPESEPATKKDAIPEADESSATGAKIDSDVEPPVAEALAETRSAAADPPPLSGDAKPLQTPSSFQSPEADAATSKPHLPESTSALGSINDTASDSIAAGNKPRSHRGSSVEEADRAKIKAIEESIKIDEHPEDDEEAIESATATDASKPLSTGTETMTEKPQETAAKDPEAATKSVED